MKFLVNCRTVLFILSLSLVLSLEYSCSDSSRDASEPFEPAKNLIEDRFLFEGHWYIYFQYPGKINYVILHDPDCDCPSRW